MQMRLTLCAAVLLFSGCYMKQINRNLRKHVNEPVDSALLKLGPPSNKAALNSGGQVMSWKDPEWDCAVTMNVDAAGVVREVRWTGDECRKSSIRTQLE